MKQENGKGENFFSREVRFIEDADGGVTGNGDITSFRISAWEVEHAHTLGAALAKIALSCKPARWTIFPPSIETLGRWADACFYAEGIITLNKRYRSSCNTPDTQLALVHDWVDLKTSVCRGRRFAQAALLAKEWVDQPRLICTPALWSAEIAKKAQSAGLIFREHLAGIDTIFPAISKVGRGSIEPPRVLEIECPASLDRRDDPPIVLCGKGVTFDSGGLGLKPQGAMRLMKADMAGAAAVAAALIHLKQSQSRPRIIGLLGITDNAVGPASLAPGDIIHMRNGFTVEVTDVDSEGRLILADLILHARELGAGSIIDVGTLSTVVSWCIGSLLAGVQSNSLSLLDTITSAGHRCGEKLWPIPLPPDQSNLMEGGWVDLVNNSGPEFGGIQPGLFLQKFVGEVPWAHLEISGPAWNSRWGGTGGTGFGARLLMEWLN